MARMTRSQAKAFRDRWQAVAAVEAEDRKSSSLEQRWAQMNALRRLMIGLRLPPPSRTDQESVVWERWSKLKDLAE
jgi:hypothetical protein